MSELRTIEIDFDIHKLIEAERRSFSESPHLALRRLLKLPEQLQENETSVLSESLMPEGRHWSGDGVTLFHGTEVKMSYNDQHYEGRIIDGKWLVGGVLFDTPSGAASGIARTRDGSYTNLSGWKYWEYRRPGDIKWSRIADAKKKVTLKDIGL